MYSLVSQLGPSHPSAQIHWYTLILSIQVPPLRQGLLSQSLMSKREIQCQKIKKKVPKSTDIKGGSKYGKLFLLSWQYVPVNPSLHSQLKCPPAWLWQRPCGPQTFEEMSRLPPGVLLDATATVQLSITEKDGEETGSKICLVDRLSSLVVLEKLEEITFNNVQLFRPENLNLTNILQWEPCIHKMFCLFFL